jgi:hypothetical protein
LTCYIYWHIKKTLSFWIITLMASHKKTQRAQVIWVQPPNEGGLSYSKVKWAVFSEVFLVQIRQIFWKISSEFVFKVKKIFKKRISNFKTKGKKGNSREKKEVCGWGTGGGEIIFPLCEPLVLKPMHVAKAGVSDQHSGYEAIGKNQWVIGSKL